MPDGLYTPLEAPYAMSWPPMGCCWCGADEMVWAYLIGDVTFWRVVAPAREPAEVDHVCQWWYACARCKRFIDGGDFGGLAEELGKPRGHFDRLRAARRPTPGRPWTRHRPGRPHQPVPVQG